MGFGEKILLVKVSVPGPKRLLKPNSHLLWITLKKRSVKRFIPKVISKVWPLMMVI